MAQWLSSVVGAVTSGIVSGDALFGANMATSGMKYNDEYIIDELTGLVAASSLLMAKIVLDPDEQKIFLEDAKGKIIATYDKVTGWIDETGESIGKTVDDIIKWARTTSKSGKEKADDIPSWARNAGLKPNPGESGKDFAERVCDQKYGKGNYNKGPGSEYNKLRKYGDRNFKK